METYGVYQKNSSTQRVTGSEHGTWRIEKSLHKRDLRGMMELKNLYTGGRASADTTDWTWEIGVGVSGEG